MLATKPCYTSWVTTGIAALHSLHCFCCYYWHQGRVGNSLSSSSISIKVSRVISVTAARLPDGSGIEAAAAAEAAAATVTAATVCRYRYCR